MSLWKHSERALASALEGPWEWPRAPLHVLSDLHGEPEALRRGLARGEVAPSERLWVLGDCLDKGPDPWGLLDALVERRAALLLLAGNHDLRVLMGLRSLGSEDPRRAHLFARLGLKTLSLLESLPAAAPLLSEAAAERALFPSTEWYAEPVGLGRDPRRELARLRRKEAALRNAWAARGRGLAELHARACAARARFEEGGRYAWFHASLRLSARLGSLLFVHAGFSDALADAYAAGEAPRWEQALRLALVEGALPGLYWGPLSPLFRTKFRTRDEAFSQDGARALRRAGVRLVVHGHLHQRRGQTLSLRGGLPHLALDTTLDAPSRRRAGLAGPGGSLTSFLPGGLLRAWSSDAGWKELRLDALP